MRRPTGFILVLTCLVLGSASVGPLVAQQTVQVGGPSGPSWFQVPAQVHAVREAQLGAQSSGRVVDVKVRSGESVKRGEVLLRIDSPAARAAAAAAVAQAAAAQAQWSSASADLERARKLHEKQYLSDAALQRAQAHATAVHAQAQASDAQARAAREMAGWEELRAPYDGWAIAVHVAAGDLAQPGQPLVSVYAPGPMRILADVPDDLREKLAADGPIQLLFPGGGCEGAPAQAKDWTMVPAVDARSRSVGVRVELGDLPRCRPGTVVLVGLPLRGASPALQVPATALVRRGELDAVYVMAERGPVQLRQVRIGERSGDVVRILAGLERGEKVIIDAARFQPPRAASER
ncbi:MAG: efflux RND transporter periplasmic adaptor subunit [Steroidobacteraceae bacterium]